MKKDILPEQGIEKLIDLASEFLKSYGEKGYMGHSTYIGAMVDFHLKMQKDSLSPVGEVTESRIKEMAKEHSEMLKMTNWDSLGDVFKQAEIGFEYGFKECLEMMRSQALSSTEWVSVEDRLPEQQAGFFICLGFTSSGHETLKLAFNCKTKRFQTMNFEDIHKLITHWMPLPNPPKSHE